MEDEIQEEIKEESSKITKEKVIDYITFAIAAIGILEAIYQLFQGNLTFAQAGSFSVFFVTLSQVGSMLRSIKAELQDL